MDLLLSKLRVRLSRHLSPGIMRAVRPFLTVQFLFFMLMGIVNTVISVGTATVLDILQWTFLSPDNRLRIWVEGSRLNFVLGYAVSIVTSFFLNSKFTFHQKPTWKRFIKFPLSYIPNFVFQYLMVLLFTALDLNSTAAYICAAILGTPVTFIAMKLMVFGKKKVAQPE